MKKYDNYKDSGIEWIGEIPEHWEVKPFKHLVICNSEALTEKTNPEMEINYIEIGDVNSFDGIKETSKYTFEKAPSRARRIVREGDVIISTVRTYLKAITSISSKFDGFIASTGFAVLTPKLIHSGFLGNIALCEGLIGEIISLSKGVSYPSITSQDLTNISIPFPSKNEQTAIANYLDHKTTQIDTLITKKEQFISLLQEERTAVINQAVTKGLDPNVKMKDSGIEWLGEIPEHWEIEKLKFKSKIISKGTTPSTVGCEIIDKGEIRYIKSENIVENCLQNNPKFYIDFETNQIIKRSQLEINDVLIVIAGASIGKVAILTEEFYPSNTNQAVSFIRLNNVNSSIFVWYWLQTSFIKERILFDATQSAQPNLSMESIGNFPIPKLSNNEEMEITTFLHKKTGEIDTIIAKTKQEIKLLQEYKTALISEVVTGKVDVRDVILN